MNAANLLINGAIFSFPLTAAVWLALRLIPRRGLNASTRYVIWWVTLAAALALPPGFLRPPAAPAPQATGPANLRVAVLELPEAPPTSAGNQLSVSLPKLLAIAWLLLSAAMLSRLLLSHLAIRRACARAADLPGALSARIGVGLRRSVRVAASPHVAVPFAAGPFRPAIVLPARMIDQLPEPDLEHIALHEAAHLARWDDCAILAERLFLAIFPWHLAARWIVRQIDAEREIACDDLVVAMSGRPYAYADCLTRVVELCGGIRGPLAAASMAVRGSQLSQRVELLVATPRPSNPRLLPAPVLPFAAGLVALVLSAAHAPSLIAFTAKKETPMTLATAKDLGRKLVVAAAATAAVAAPPPRPQTPPAAPAGRNIAILLDAAASPADLQRGADAVVKFVQTQLRSGDKAALLVSTDNGVSVRQDFTADREILTDAVRHVETTAVEATAPNQRLTASLGAAVRILGAVTGKKALVYLSAVKPEPSADQVKSLVDDAVRANVAFYFVDVRGQ